MKVHSEIIYTKKSNSLDSTTNILTHHSVHSDACPKDCDFNNLTKDHKQYLHDLLDEWLNESNGTGIFYIKEEDFIPDFQTNINNLKSE